MFRMKGRLVTAICPELGEGMGERECVMSKILVPPEAFDLSTNYEVDARGPCQRQLVILLARSELV
jgi:hypothetical protein